MSYPLFVEDAKLYKRNAFLFAFGMVFPENTETKPYQAVLRKLGQFMRDLEIERQYLSKEGTRSTFCEVSVRLPVKICNYHIFVVVENI